MGRGRHSELRKRLSCVQSMCHGTIKQHTLRTTLKLNDVDTWKSCECKEGPSLGRQQRTAVFHVQAHLNNAIAIHSFVS